MEKTYSVYWITNPETHTDIKTEGYIGITNDFESRMKEQRASSSNPHLGNAIKKYGWDNLDKKVVSNGLSLLEALALEGRLRPTKQIGWNINVGGGVSLADNAKVANIYKGSHLIATGVCLTTFANDHGLDRSHLAKTARGERPMHMGYRAEYIGE